VVIKSLYTLAGFLGLYIIVSDWLQPILEQANNMHFAELFLKLIEVCFYLNLVIFYIVMETMLQLFAEFTRFADRLFYADWWNSTSYIDYMIKFNRPVSDFTYRYVYEPL
jgi:sterol O-acyltransferase